MMLKELDKVTKQEYTTKITLMGVFISIFAAFVTRRSGKPKAKAPAKKKAGLLGPANVAAKGPGQPFSISPFDLALLGLSTFRLGRMLAFDQIAEPLRLPFAQTVPDPTGEGMTVKPKRTENGVIRSFGQLISCPICIGTWIAAGLVYGLQSLPNPTRVLMAIMGTMGVAEMLDAVAEGFLWVGQLARYLSGSENMKREQLSEREGTPISNFFNSGGNYYVGPDHEKHYRQGRGG